MKLLAKATAIFDGTINLLADLASVLIILMMLGISTDVAMRYFFVRPISWMVEIAEHSLLFVTFLGAAWVLKGEGHVKMDIVLNRLKPGTQALLNMITSILGAIICLFLVWYGAQVTWEYFQIGYVIFAVLSIPSAYIIIIIPVGSFLLFIQFLRRSYGYLKSWRASLDKEPGL
jgi:TRAP-type C4-dicarboxylate transport system permease small subunit